MAKHFNASQFKSQLRKLEQDNRRVINDFNRKIRSFKASYNKAVNAYNNIARQYNSAVRKISKSFLVRVGNSIILLKARSTLLSEQCNDTTPMSIRSTRKIIW